MSCHSHYRYCQVIKSASRCSPRGHCLSTLYIRGISVCKPVEKNRIYWEPPIIWRSLKCVIFPLSAIVQRICCRHVRIKAGDNMVSQICFRLTIARLDDILTSMAPALGRMEGRQQSDILTQLKLQMAKRKPLCARLIL